MAWWDVGMGSDGSHESQEDARSAAGGEVQRLVSDVVEALLE